MTEELSRVIMRRSKFRCKYRKEKRGVSRNVYTTQRKDCLERFKRSFFLRIEGSEILLITEFFDSL